MSNNKYPVLIVAKNPITHPVEEIAHLLNIGRLPPSTGTISRAIYIQKRRWLVGKSYEAYRSDFKCLKKQIIKSQAFDKPQILRKNVERRSKSDLKIQTQAKIQDQLHENKPQKYEKTWFDTMVTFLDKGAKKIVALRENPKMSDEESEDSDMMEDLKILVEEEAEDQKIQKEKEEIESHSRDLSKIARFKRKFDKNFMIEVINNVSSLLQEEMELEVSDLSEVDLRDLVAEDTAKNMTVSHSVPVRIGIEVKPTYAPKNRPKRPTYVSRYTADLIKKMPEADRVRVQKSEKKKKRLFKKALKKREEKHRDKAEEQGKRESKEGTIVVNFNFNF
jgi:hypothetical protein